MNQKPYSAYRGRKSAGRRVLTVLAVILGVLLVLGIAAVVILPNYVVYTEQGPVLPIFGGKATPAPAPATAPPSAPLEEMVVVETPAPTPTPSAAPTPIPAAVSFERRETPGGLLPFDREALEDGSAAAGLREDQGAVFNVTDWDLTGLDPEQVRALPYAAAYLVVDWAGLEAHDIQAAAQQAAAMEAAGESADGAAVAARYPFFREILAARAAELAAAGFDEVLLSAPAGREDVGDMTMAAAWNTVAETLEGAGFEGRLSTVVRQYYFTEAPYVERVLPGVGSSFERVYAFRGDSWSGLHLYRTLTECGFRGNTTDIVTVTGGAVAGAGYPWAVLPG